MDKIKEMIQARKLKIYDRIESDEKYSGDPILGRFLEGKITAEKEEFEFYEDLLKTIGD